MGQVVNLPGYKTFCCFVVSWTEKDDAFYVYRLGKSEGHVYRMLKQEEPDWYVLDVQEEAQEIY